MQSRPRWWQTADGLKMLEVAQGATADSAYSCTLHILCYAVHRITEVSVPVAAPGAWPRARRCWWTKCFPNSRYRARVTPAKRGRGSQRCSTGDSQAPTPGERRASMAGFCSCKTGIHAIHGNNVGAAPEARIRHRHRDLPGLWRGGEDHRLHPTAGQGLFLQSFCIPAIAHGKDCSCNPLAFPPSMAVRCARAAIPARINCRRCQHLPEA